MEHYTLNKYPEVRVGALRNVNEKYKAIKWTFLGQLLLCNWKPWCMFLVSSDRVYRGFQIKDSHSFLDSMYCPSPFHVLVFWTQSVYFHCCMTSPVSEWQIMFFHKYLCVFSLTDVFLHVNPEVSVYFSTGRKIWKRHAKHVFNCRKE